MDYWNIMVDRVLGSSITVDLSDIYLEQYTDGNGVTHHAVHNKHTDRVWLINESDFQGVQQQLKPKGI